MHWWVFLWASVGFIIYGSLFPFDFQATPLSLDHFYTEWHLFRDRSDALDNFLLFVPLGIALHACFPRPQTRLIAAVLAVLLLAIGIQLLQLYLPSRTASLSDVFWNTVGMSLGFLAATRAQRVLNQRLAQKASVHDYFAMLLVVLWFFYESFPFVPTLDIGLLRDHLKSAFFPLPFEPMRFLQHALAAALGSIAMLRAQWLQPRSLNLIVLGGMAFFLEIFVAYGNLRRETLLGILLGLLAGYALETQFKQRSHRAVFLLALCAYLITVLTPYRAQTLGGGFTFTPFAHLFWQGITKDIPPTAFEALAIGSMLWAGLVNQHPPHRRPLLWIWAVLGLLALFELVRVFILGFHGDSTPLVVALVLSPFASALASRRSIVSKQKHDRHPGDASITPSPPRATASFPNTPMPRKIIWRNIILSWLGLTLGLCLLLQLPGIPYNLKKIFGSQILWGASIFSLALLWLGSGPWLITRHLLHLEAQQRHGMLHALMRLPFYLLGLALVSFLLVDMATPAVMLNKIIGAPDLYRRIVEDNLWGSEWQSHLRSWPAGWVNLTERVVRYCALYTAFMIPLTLAALSISNIAKDRRVARVLTYLLWLFPLWWLTKYVVLDWAITDNLTELITPHGVPLLACIVSIAALHAAWLACIKVESIHLQSRRLIKPILLTAMLLPASWWLLQQSIESVIINNGRVFSGLQFLLGENRTAWLSEPALFARWCALYIGAVGLVAIGMRHAMRLWPDQPPIPDHPRATRHRVRSRTTSQPAAITPAHTEPVSHN